MARTLIAKQSLAVNGGVAQAAGTAIDQANGMYFVPGKGGKTILRMTNTDATARNITIKKGVGSYGSEGDMVVSLPISGVLFIGPLETARFVQADGTIYVDSVVSTAGNVLAITLP